MKDVSELHYLLGVQAQLKDGVITLDQEQYLIKLLMKFEESDVKTVTTPQDSSVKLDKEDGYSIPVNVTQSITYWQFIVCGNGNTSRYCSRNGHTQ